jgi:hypothetical protein
MVGGRFSLATNVSLDPKGIYKSRSDRWSSVFSQPQHERVQVASV